MRRSVSVTAIVVLFSMLLMSSVPTVNSGHWASGPTMGTARTDAVATLLQDGRVLITGGTDATGATLGSADVFGVNGTFSSAAPMLEGRSGHAAVVLKDGTVLVTGGTTSAGPTNSAEIYNAGNNTWTAAGAMTEARSGHTATLLTDGRVVLIGGANSAGPSATIDIFDPVSKSFTSAGSLAIARKGHATAALANGAVLVTGGFGANADGSSVALSSSEIFDSRTGSVSSAAPLAVARGGHSATTLLDGSVVVIGGNNGTSDLSSAEVYQAATGTWSAISGSALQTARSGHSAFLLPNNNSVLIVGGDAAGVDQASAELFIPWSGHFQNTGALSTARAGASGAALSADGLLLLAGGSNLASSEYYGFATVKTDKSDYAPGTSVTITGSGWQPGEVVRLVLQESPDFDEHPAMTATADAFGNIINTQFAPDQHDIGIRFYLTAYGIQSQAQNTFTDANPATKLKISGSATQIAGTANSLTITALDATNATATSYTGDKSLTFSYVSGSGTIGTFNPTVTDKTGAAVNFGTATTITFVNGVATVTGSSNGSMTLYKAGSPTITVTDGSISSGTAALRQAVTVSAASLAQFTVVLASPQTNGVNFTGTNAIAAQDAYGNVVTTFDASTDNVTFTTSLSGVVKGLDGANGNILNQSTEFVNGICNLTAQHFKYFGTIGTGTFTATSASAKTGTSGSVTINPGTATDLQITGASTQIAGTVNNLTITALDSGGNTATGYTGDKSLTFVGANPIGSFNPTVTDKTGAAVNFTNATTITFTNGVASISGSSNGAMTLYRSEIINIAATDGSITASGSNRLHVGVSSAGLGQFAFSLTSPQTNGASFTGTNTLTALDIYGNTVRTFDASANPVTVTTSLGGSVKGLHTAAGNVLNQAADFTTGVADMTALGMSYVGSVGAGTFTATSANSKVGTSANVTINPGSSTRLVVTGSATQTAGSGNNLTITAEDGSGNTVTSYTGVKSLVFSGASTTISSLHPTVNDNSGTAVNFGNATAITFTNGVATVSGGSNGIMTLYKAEVASIGVFDGTTTTATADKLTVTVSAANATLLSIGLPAFPSPTVAGASHNFRVTAGDQYDNRATGYTGTVHFVSNDGAAVLPADYPYTAADQGTHLFTATLNTGGLKAIKVTDISNASLTDTQSNILVQSAPTFTSANHTTFTVGSTGNFTVTTTGVPAPTLTESGFLPSGVVFVDNNNGTATISGNPAVGSGGLWPITITAHNAAGTVMQSFTLTVNEAPAVTSSAFTTFVAGQASTFTVTTRGYPAPTISETGALPSNVTFVDNHNGTATISGTPAANTGGIYSVVIGVTNGIGVPTLQTFNFTLTVNEAAAITSAATTTYKVGVAGTFTVTTRGFPKPTLSEVGALPQGVTFVDNMNGTATLNGTPMVAGTFNLVITAHNGVGSDATQNFTLIVNKGDSTSKVTGPSGNFFSNGQLVTLTATVTGKGVTPTGTVKFLTSTTQGYTLGTVAVGANGVATLKVVLPPGNNYIHTEYSGDSNYLPSNSPFLLVWMY